MAKPPAAYNRPFALVKAMQAADWPAAEKVLREALKKQRPHPVLFADLAMALREQGKTADAVQALKRAVKLAPGEPALWFELGLTQMEARKWADARKTYASIHRKVPQDPIAILNLGTIALELKQPAEAAEHFAKVADHPALDDDQRAYAAINLVEALRDSGDPESMRQAADKAVQAHPHAREALDRIVSAEAGVRTPPGADQSSG